MNQGIKRFMSKVRDFIKCHIFLHHDWTTLRKKNPDMPAPVNLEQFLVESRMFCDNCRHISDYSKRFEVRIIREYMLSKYGKK